MTQNSLGPLTKEMIATLERQRLGFVATVSPEGKPMVSPKGTFVCLGPDQIAFGEIRSPQTIRNLARSSAVEVNFVDPLSRKGFRASGRAEVFKEADSEFETLIPAFDRWGDLAKRIRRIVVINIKQATVLSTPAYDDGAQENDLRKQWAETLLDAADLKRVG